MRNKIICFKDEKSMSNYAFPFAFLFVVWRAAGSEPNNDVNINNQRSTM